MTRPTTAALVNMVRRWAFTSRLMGLPCPPTRAGANPAARRTGRAANSRGRLAAVSFLRGRRSANASGPVGGLSFDEWQVSFTIAVVVIAWVDIRPIGFDGKGLALLVLLVVNSALVLQRAVPDRIIGPRPRLALLAIGVMASALIMGVDSNSWAVAFPFLIAGHAGFKLPARAAIAVAAGTSLACVAALIVASHHDPTTAPWYLGAFTGLPVFIGQSNRGYRQAVEAAHLRTRRG